MQEWCGVLVGVGLREQIEECCAFRRLKEYFCTFFSVERCLEQDGRLHWLRKAEGDWSD